MAQWDSTHEPDCVDAACMGDMNALEHLYELYSRRIYSYVYVRLRDHSEAQDITAQVFLKMVEKIGDYKQRGAGFPAWLFRIAHNQIIDAQRKQSHRYYVPLDGASEVAASDASDPYKLAERRNFLFQIKECISLLTDLQAQVITLKYAGELSNPEISAVMSRSTNAINSLHYEALKKLEKLLTEKGYTF